MTWWQQLLISISGGVVVAGVSIYTTWRINKSDRDKQNQAIQLDEARKIISLLNEDGEELVHAETDEKIRATMYSPRLLEIRSSISIGLPSHIRALLPKYLEARHNLLLTKMEMFLVRQSGEQAPTQMGNLAKHSSDLSEIVEKLLHGTYAHLRSLSGLKESE